LAPLGLLVAGITHALANTEKKGRHDDGTEDNDGTEASVEPGHDLSSYLPSLHERQIRPIPRTWELPSTYETYEFPQFTFREPLRQERPAWMNVLSDMPLSNDVDSEDEEPAMHDEEPSIRNERYFERQR
jgi:hypothetical protein